MRLYIANCTKQIQQIQYRADFPSEQNGARFTPPRMQEIAPGRQVQLGGDMDISQIEDIVQQLTPYGLVAVADVPRMRTTVKSLDLSKITTTPNVFNIDRPVPVEIMRHISSNNAEILSDHGRLRRQRAAVAVNDLVQRKVNDEFVQNGLEEVASDRVDTSFEQLDQSEHGEKPIAEGYRVRAAAPQEDAPSRRGRGKAKKK